jgi:hypothetical protein
MNCVPIEVHKHVNRRIELVAMALNSHQFEAQYFGEIRTAPSTHDASTMSKRSDKRSSHRPSAGSSLQHGMSFRQRPGLVT